MILMNRYLALLAFVFAIFLEAASTCLGLLQSSGRSGGLDEVTGLVEVVSGAFLETSATFLDFGVKRLRRWS